MNTSAQTKKAVKAMRKGKPFTTRHFLKYGSRAAVDKALSRLVKEGVITRVSRGVFVRPELNKYVGEVPPKPIEVAKAIANKKSSKGSKEKVSISGAEAALAFGLTTQVPTRPVYYTTSESKSFKLNNLEVQMRHVSPAILEYAERPSGNALIALLYLGEEKVNLSVIRSVTSKLPEGEFELLKSGRASMPSWLSDKFHRYEQLAA